VCAREGVCCARARHAARCFDAFPSIPPSVPPNTLQFIIAFCLLRSLVLVVLLSSIVQSLAELDAIKGEGWVEDHSTVLQRVFAHMAQLEVDMVHTLKTVSRYCLYTAILVGVRKCGCAGVRVCGCGVLAVLLRTG
jgi:hypothetical protein